jgi:ketosteroid isomerase-like protein
MSKNCILPLFTFLLLVSNLSFGQSSAIDSKLAAAQDQYFAALINKDYQNLEALYDDSFVGILSTGKKMDKAGLIDYQKTSDVQIYKSFEELDTRIYGDVAVCTGLEINKAKSGTKLGQIRFIRIYVKKNNIWKIVNSQFTSII